MKRIGILTSGTVSPGMNAAIRAIARTVFQSGKKVVVIENGFDGCYDKDLISLPHWSFFQGLLYKGGSILGLPQHGDPYNFPVIRNNKLEHIDKSYECISNIKDFDIDCLIVIGSKKDLQTCKKLEKENITTVFIPNYINNDFFHSTYTFGFKTTVQTASSYLDRLHTTAESHHRVFIVEVIGLHSGWIALESGISGGADVILIPEIRFDLQNIIRTLEERKTKGAPFSLIVTAQGAQPEDVDLKKDKLSVTQYLSDQLKEKIDLEIRSLSLTLIQRGGTPIGFDRILASEYGVTAAEEAIKTTTSKAIIYTNTISSIDLKDSKETLKQVSLESPLINVINKLNISLGIK